MTDFYRMGKQYSFRPRDEYMYDDLPEMSFHETIEFNRGYADGIEDQKKATRMLVVLCVVTVAACVFFWWVGE